MNAPTILPKLDHDHHRSTNTTTTTTTITTQNNPVKLITTKKAEPLSSKLKCVRKKRSAGKKDRQSKIHTAQGLRDRRMRLSVHTARKFFDLNDMLGFDKASKTIEWLFNKSHKAIQEIAETLRLHGAAQTENRDNNIIGSPLSACETESVMDIATSTDKDENLKLHGDPIEDENSRKPETEREAGIKDRIMIKNFEKKKQLFDAIPSVDFNLSRTGFEENLEDHNMKESSCYPVEFSNTYHFLKHLHLDNTVRNTNNIYMGNHSVFDYSKIIAEPPACLLNSRNSFSGFLEGWNSVNPRMESNSRIMPNIGPMSGNSNRDNSSSAMLSSSFMNFSSDNRGR